MRNAGAECEAREYARFVMCVSGTGLIPARRGRGAEEALLAVGDVSKRQVSGEAEWRSMSSAGTRHTQQARQGFFLF